MSSKIRRPAPEGGFTIIEILIAAAILGTLAAIVTVSFSTTIRLRDTALDDGGREHLARNCLRVMAEELASGRRHPSGLWIGRNLMVEGQPADLLVFNSTANVRTRPDIAEADTARIVYTREGDRLVRYSTRNPYVLTTEAIDRTELASGVTALNLRYLDRKLGIWVDQWYEGGDSPPLPNGVMIELTLLNGRREPRTYTAWVATTPVPMAVALQSGPGQ
jgi:general secretion pathway protein J